MPYFKQTIDTLKLLPTGGPSVCNIAITNVCNAKCSFCNYAADKPYVQERTWVDAEDFRSAAGILHSRGIRYVTLVGGEPLLHPQILQIVAHAAATGIRPAIVTNGSRLSPAMVQKLDAAGLSTLFVSIDAASSHLHEANRGLPGICKRIREAVQASQYLRMKAVASVTINKLIDDYPALLRYLAQLGFDTVNFAYPKTMLHSPALSFSNDSELIDFTPDELARRLDTIQSLKGAFHILNSREALNNIKHFLRRQSQPYPCFGGYKYFYIDYHLDVYRCDFWPERMCSIEAFRNQDFIREPCTLCISGCYRDASVLMHAAVALADAMALTGRGRISAAVRRMAEPTNISSIKTLVQDWATIRKLAKRPPAE